MLLKKFFLKCLAAACDDDLYLRLQVFCLHYCKDVFLHQLNDGSPAGFSNKKLFCFCFSSTALCFGRFNLTVLTPPQTSCSSNKLTKHGDVYGQDDILVQSKHKPELTNKRSCSEEKFALITANLSIVATNTAGETRCLVRYYNLMYVY